MSGFAQWIGLDLMLLSLLGIGLLAALRVTRFLIDVLPMSVGRRAAAQRAAPVLGVVLVLFYVLLCVRTLFRDQPAYLPIALSLAFAGFVAASWPAARDLLAGVALKAGRVCRVGDRVRIENLEGKVVRMGMRVLVLETTRGDEVLLPYGRIAREAVVRTRSEGGVASHEFSLKLPPGLGAAEARTRIKRAALLCHWAAVGRDPEVIPSAEADALDVTVFALDPEHAHEIENAVRGALAPATSTPERSRPAPASA